MTFINNAKGLGPNQSPVATPSPYNDLSQIACFSHVFKAIETMHPVDLLVTSYSLGGPTDFHINCISYLNHAELNNEIVMK